MGKSIYMQIDTPALLIDYDIMIENLNFMKKKAEQFQVNLRPHTKTHKMPYLAQLQSEYGITVAKVSEAEVMAQYGLHNIFIANEIVGLTKLEKIRTLHRQITIRLGVDNTAQVDQLAAVFMKEEQGIEVLIEIEVGENRSGVNTEEEIIQLAKYIHEKEHVILKGVFSHEGHTYKAQDIEDCLLRTKIAHEKTVKAANLIRSLGIPIDVVSVGATPSLMQAAIAEGVTEIRPGTYLLMDAGQAAALQTTEHCAATVLTTVISKPTDERIVLDAGAKALMPQNRAKGICCTQGLGVVKNSEQVTLSEVFDEHGIIYNKRFSEKIHIGDKIEIIPNHICPTCNLYDKAYLVSQGKVIKELPILCRGKCQ